MNNDENIQQFVAYLLEVSPFRNEEQRRSKQRVDRVLRAFCYMVEHDITPPKSVLEFIASGVTLHLEGSKSPWPTNNKRKVPDSLIAIIQLTDRRHPGHREDIAAHAGVSARQVGNYLAEKSLNISFHLGIYEKMYANADMATMLNAISGMTEPQPE